MSGDSSHTGTFNIESRKYLGLVSLTVYLEPSLYTSLMNLNNIIFINLKIYDACVQRVLVYGSETWAIKAEDLARLRRAERMMVRRMCGVSLKDRKRSDELLNRLGIECVENKIQRGRLRWFGHVERKEENNWVKKCTRMNVIGVVDRGAPRKTWRSCVKRDMKAMGIKEEMAQDRCAWRNITGGPTRASADA